VLLKNSDIVTIHVPYTLESQNLITKKELDLMKDCAYLINISKAEIVNIRDLYSALKEKRMPKSQMN
jgi:lactate dehydrogenase-like 2-hydroxyacid dehydrogenase